MRVSLIVILAVKSNPDPGEVKGVAVVGGHFCAIRQSNDTLVASRMVLRVAEIVVGFYLRTVEVSTAVSETRATSLMSFATAFM